MDNDTIGIIGIGVTGIGFLIAMIGYIWLIVKGFQVGGALWGILNILVQPIGGLIFCIMHKTGWAAFALLILGYVVMTGGLVPVLMTSHIF